jgi:glycosyltransferase involved in cell wall biosynthesis
MALIDMDDRRAVLDDLVSIIIVAHNNWPDLELAIESALGQSWPRKEVIVVDNESTDATREEVARRYGDRLRYVRQANARDGGGYNRGIAEALGDFVQLLDGDDFLAPNKIARQMEVFYKRPAADIVYGEARQFQGGAGRPAWSDWETTAQKDMLAALIDPAAEGAGLVIHSALFRRSALEKTGPWDESLTGADMDYWIRAAWNGCAFEFSPGAWCFHRRRPGQMSSATRTMLHRTLSTLEKALTYVDREPYRSMIRRRASALRLGMALTDLELDRASALSELEAARTHDPAHVGRLSYLIAQAVIRTPGARRLIKLPMMSAIRRPAAKALGARG